MIQDNPLVSVIIPLYNTEKYIEEAVKSILSQTYKNLEVIIIDDGSKDNSGNIVKRIDDKRIKLICQENSGMAAALNKGIAMAKGEYIARQDADDIAYPQRLEKQISFLQKNEHYAVVGTWAKVFSDDNKEHKAHQHPADNLTLKLFLLFDNPFVHSSMMIRKSVLDKIGNYDVKKSQLTQDYDLWSRIARDYEIANMPEMLQAYRKVTSGISHTTSDYSTRVVEQSIENISILAGSKSTAVSDLAYLYHSDYEKLSDDVSFEKIEDVFNKIADKFILVNSGDLNSFQAARKNYLNLLRRKLKRYKRFGNLLVKSRSFYKRIKG